MKTEHHDVSTLTALAAVAAQFKNQLQPGDLVELHGDLGAGKTTFVQQLLQSAGLSDVVKSPTYNLYECYQTGTQSWIHMDLYRLTDPEELYFLGIEELCDDNNILLVEWPEKGRGVLPAARWRLEFSMQNLNRTLTITSNQ